MGKIDQGLLYGRITMADYGTEPNTIPNSIVGLDGPEQENLEDNRHMTNIKQHDDDIERNGTATASRYRALPCALIGLLLMSWGGLTTAPHTIASFSHHLLTLNSR